MNIEKKDSNTQKSENFKAPETDISYQVMPRLEGKKTMISSSPKEEPFAPLKRKEKEGEHKSEFHVEGEVAFIHKPWVRISLIALGLVVIGALVYGWYAYRTTKEAPPTVSTRLPKVWLLQYFGSEFCSDQSNCGDEADPDQDGLSNVDEFKEGTSPLDSDTDKDGLSDGDEVNVYKTDSVLKFTDRRVIATQEGFTDGHSILNGYDPLTPGIKLTQIRLGQIASDINEFGLHEPTITTLNLQGSLLNSNQLSTVSVFIEANEFLPQTMFIKTGDTVVWLNKDVEQHKVKHNLSSNLPVFESGVLGQDQTYSFKFETSGSYNYLDELNPLITGIIEVR